MLRTSFPFRTLQFLLGLFLYGFSSALQVRSELGLSPWDVLNQGLAERLDVKIGTVAIALGAILLLAWFPLRQRPRWGTFVNVLLVGLSINLGLVILPKTDSGVIHVVELLAGVLLGGLATGLYLGARFGAGPRDGVMTGLAERTGGSIRLVRTSMEVTVLATGWLLGGTVGIGTALFALTIGPSAQFFMRIFNTLPDRTERAPKTGALATDELR